MKRWSGGHSLAFVAALLSGAAAPYAPIRGMSPQEIAFQDRKYLEVTFLDVGQGDVVLIRAPEGQTALVDAGTTAPLDALASHGVPAVDLLVASHPHEDHIGGMVGVLAAVTVRNFTDNGEPHTTATYRELVRALERSPRSRTWDRSPAASRWGAARSRSCLCRHQATRTSTTVPCPSSCGTEPSRSC